MKNKLKEIRKNDIIFITDIFVTLYGYGQSKRIGPDMVFKCTSD